MSLSGSSGLEELLKGKGRVEPAGDVLVVDVVAVQETGCSTLTGTTYEAVASLAQHNRRQLYTFAIRL